MELRYCTSTCCTELWCFWGVMDSRLSPGCGSLSSSLLCDHFCLLYNCKLTPSAPFTVKRHKEIICTSNCKTFKRCSALSPLARITSDLSMGRLYTQKPPLAPRGLSVMVCVMDFKPRPSPVPPNPPPLLFCDLFLVAPSLKALVVPGLADPWDHVQQQPAAEEQTDWIQPTQNRWGVTQGRKSLAWVALAGSFRAEIQTFGWRFFKLKLPFGFQEVTGFSFSE